MSYPLTHIGGLDVEEVRSLKAQGIRTTERLLEQAKNPRGRKLLATKTGINEKRLLMAANAADHLRIKGMGKGYVVLLREIGVNTVRDLRVRKPENLVCPDGGGQPEAETGPPAAFGKAGRAMGRGRQETSPQDHL